MARDFCALNWVKEEDRVRRENVDTFHILNSLKLPHALKQKTFVCDFRENVYFNLIFSGSRAKGCPVSILLFAWLVLHFSQLSLCDGLELYRNMTRRYKGELLRSVLLAAQRNVICTRISLLASLVKQTKDFVHQGNPLVGGIPHPSKSTLH